MSLHDFTAVDIEGNERSLNDFAGKLVLVVNTASECGFTPQYEGLQELYETYGDQGFTVLGFPSNQFGQQEPASNEEIAAFCSTNFHVTFPMFEKIMVNGEQAHPLYKWLTKETTGILGGRIAWNFTKFLIGRDGEVIKRFAPPIPPARISHTIEEHL